MIRIENIEKDFNEDTKIHLKDLKFENGIMYIPLYMTMCIQTPTMKYFKSEEKTNAADAVLVVDLIVMMTGASKIYDKRKNNRRIAGAAG